MIQGVTYTDSPGQSTPGREYSAGAVIFRKEAGQILYLLLYYEEGHWGSAKGHVENRETTEETARREIREETGLTGIRFVSGFKEEVSYSFQGNQGAVHKSVVFLLAETYLSAIRLSTEHIDYRWLTYSEALEKITFADEKAILQKAQRFLLEQTS
jgi:bis(5'-nucleosidyl)-tetraphosphatase